MCAHSQLLQHPVGSFKRHLPGSDLQLRPTPGNMTHSQPALWWSKGALPLRIRLGSDLLLRPTARRLTHSQPVLWRSKGALPQDIRRAQPNTLPAKAPVVKARCH